MKLDQYTGPTPELFPLEHYWRTAVNNERLGVAVVPMDVVRPFLDAGWMEKVRGPNIYNTTVSVAHTTKWWEYYSVTPAGVAAAMAAAKTQGWK